MLKTLSCIGAVARMERRHTQRLLRYWIFLTIACSLALGLHFYYSRLHAFYSALSASVGMIGPRYLMGSIALWYLTGFVLGIVFLGFDVRARDIREGIVDVLDARPPTNLELVSGRFLALFLAAWIPIVILALSLQGLGWLLPLLGVPIGRTVEPLSLANFVFLTAVPAIAFAVALVFVITLLVRHRLIAALLSIAVIVGLYWTMGLAGDDNAFEVPGAFIPLVDYFGVGQAALPSDIVPHLVIPGGGLQRVGVLVLAIGLLGIAAAIHPRLDGGRRWRSAACSAALFLVGFACVWLVTQQRLGERAQVEQWRSAHEARAKEPIADILSIVGSVEIEPGRRLDAALTLEVAAPADGSLSRVLLTLNPGLVLEEVGSADGAPLAAEQGNGLLDIELDRTLGPGERTSLTLRYGGRPDTSFGYLESADGPNDQEQVAVLGYEHGIFDRRYVALTPGIRWLPASGVDVGRDDPRERRTDYFRVTLDVALPASWLAAGPGKRQVLSSSEDGVKFRFAPQTSVPEVALMAGEFESFATEIDGITFEVLVHPAHDSNFKVLAGAREAVEQWIADRLELAAAAGLRYPFDAFTVVEVPNTLRSYEGGWRLDTALAPPAMMLMRETSFPTARFDFDVNADKRDVDQEGGEARIMRDRLVNFFSNDFSGGNIFTGAARSFFAHRTSAYGPDAIALDFVLDELATLLVSGQRGYFSAHLITSVQAVGNIGNVVSLQGGSSVAETMISTRTQRADVWSAALDSPLSGLDPWANPQRTIDLLTLKGGEMAQTIYDTLGPQAVGDMLAYLLDHHGGGSFTLADLVAAGDHVNEDLGGLFEDWVTATGMPGFLAEDAELYRLPDTDSGESRYQLLVRVNNGEAVVGFTRLAWSMEAGGERTLSAPIRIAGHSAIEFGVVLSQPPAAAYVHPYLSLNRGDFLAGILNRTRIPTRDVEPLDGVREVALSSGGDHKIVADDLDAGFLIVSGDAEGDLRPAGRARPGATMDEGPQSEDTRPPDRWSRWVDPTAWGRYRHTMTVIRAGDGTRRAVMPVSIPLAGLWELEIHVPFTPIMQPQDRGTWNLEIVSADGRETVSYNAALANVGWNPVGEYQLPAGEVRVEISDRTDGLMVVADAVGWSPGRVRTETTERDSR